MIELTDDGRFILSLHDHGGREMADLVLRTVLTFATGGPEDFAPLVEMRKSISSGQFKSIKVELTE